MCNEKWRFSLVHWLNILKNCSHQIKSIELKEQYIFMQLTLNTQLERSDESSLRLNTWLQYNQSGVRHWHENAWKLLMSSALHSTRHYGGKVSVWNTWTAFQAGRCSFAYSLGCCTWHWFQWLDIHIAMFTEKRTRIEFTMFSFFRECDELLRILTWRHVRSTYGGGRPPYICIRSGASAFSISNFMGLTISSAHWSRGTRSISYIYLAS